MKAELLILGVLHRGNFHPYEIKRRLRNAMVECYTDVDVGTLYYAIRQLQKNKLIVAVRRERVARGGARTVYGISASGKQRFQELLNEQFAAEGPVANTLYGAMLFLQFSNLPLIAELLRTRISRETVAMRKIAEIRKELGSVPATGALHLLKHLELQHRLDRKWLQGVLADVEGGRVRDVTDPKRLTRGWRAGKSRAKRRPG
ncbi:MAG TPA: PadR family transcriptional regulator [Candidatus Acidoferrales bacterium]|nr:PadR family transcriptional regulator [Candidatus Acidoferrales bacterium]